MVDMKESKWTFSQHHKNCVAQLNNFRQEEPPGPEKQDGRPDGPGGANIIGYLSDMAIKLAMYKKPGWKLTQNRTQTYDIHSSHSKSSTSPAPSGRIPQRRRQPGSNSNR